MKKIVVTFLMASGVALFSTMPMMSQTTVALSATEKSAQDDYFKALDALMSGKMANA